MKKILHVITDLNVGGAGIYLTTYLKNRDTSSFDVTVCMPKGSLLKPYIEKTGAKIIELEGFVDKSFSISAISKLYKVMCEVKPNIVHTHASLSARIAAKRYGKCKIVFTRHCDFEPSKIYKLHIVRFLNGFLNKKLADRIIATSVPAKENLIKQGINQKLITVILNGTDGFKKLPKEEITKIKESYKIKDEVVIGYLARVEELKGHRYLLEAVKILDKLQKEGKLDFDFKVIIAGDGSFLNKAKELAEDFEISNKVIFTGFISDVEKILNIFDVGLNCSYLSETTCLSLLEGMSLGIPQVATKCAGNIYVIRDGENGILVDKASSVALAKGIKQILSSKEKFNYMKNKSIEIFEENYTAKIFAKNIEEVYKEL